MAASRFVQRGRRMAFAAAGHPPAMLISSGDLRRLDSHSGILGTKCSVLTASKYWYVNRPGNLLLR
jgi:hypothetical protein